MNSPWIKGCGSPVTRSSPCSLRSEGTTHINLCGPVGGEANVANVVGLVDLNTGLVTPVATGFKGVHGLAFSPTRVGVAQTERPNNDQSEGSDDV